MDSNLLVTKIIVPSKRTDVLQRRRLLDFMHDYLGRKLLLVSATAGYGKTSLLVDFAHDTDLPVCWYSLDERDRDPQVFMEYLVAAIQRRFPHFGGRTTALLHSTNDKRTTDTYIGSLVTEIHEQIDTFFVIVLDDYQLVEDSAPINQLLDRLLSVLPENAHFIVASRTIPAQLNLTRLTAQQQVTGLGAGDLRFTADEIRAWVRQNYNLEISPTIADDLASQSEGWITGIVLTTPTLWRGLVQEWVKGYGPGSQLFEYLADQVLLQQSLELQQFLLDTSVLGEMTGALCNEFLGRSDAEELLQLAEKRNLFITRLQDQGYRYHHLFRDFLLTRLRQTQPTRWTHLLEKAAALFERHNKFDQAIEQWLAAEKWSQAARLLLNIAESYFQLGRWTSLSRWLDTLSRNDAVLEPELLLWRALLGAESGEIDLARRTFAQAQTKLEQRGETVKLARVLIESARYDDSFTRGIDKCRRALKILPPHEYQLHALGNRTMGVLTARSGDNLGAVELLTRAVELSERANNRYLQSEMESDLGGVNLLLGNWQAAETHFQNARTYWERLGHRSKLANALNNLAVLRYQQGELPRALELLLEALKQSHQSGYLRVEGYVLASLGDIYRDQGKFTEALDAYMSAAELANKVHEGFLTIFSYVAAADIWRMTGEYATAEKLLNATLNTATLHDSDYEVALVQMALGALALAQQDLKAGVRLLEYALPLLEQSNAKRDVARTRFFLARAAIERKQTTVAVQHLRALAALGAELDEDQFLWSEFVHAPFVLDFALGRKTGLTYYRRIAKRLAQQPQNRSPRVIALQTSYPSLKLYVLGEARAYVDGELVQKSAWQTATTQELFFFFATNPQGWRKEQVIAQMWSNAQTGQASDLFHACVYRIRRALFAECLVYQNGIYQLNPEVVRWLDVEEFEKALTLAQQTKDLDQKRSALEQAIELYQGDLMTDIYSDWSTPRRDQLRARYLDALTHLARHNATSGNSSRALDLYQQALVTDPVHEETYRGLMELYASQGNRAAALQTYLQCADKLDRELGAPPMAETTALYHRLLNETNSP